MVQFLSIVEDTFAIEGRGLVIVPGIRLSDPSARVYVGDPLELRRADGTTQVTSVRGIEMGGRGDFIPLLLADGITKDDVPIGTEVWLLRNEAKGGGA